jgi:hypothetical protein
MDGAGQGGGGGGAGVVKAPPTAMLGNTTMNSPAAMQ